jgi:hypothetical protein
MINSMQLNHVALLKSPLPQRNLELVPWYITKSGFGVVDNIREFGNLERQRQRPGAHIRNKFEGVSYVLGPTFVVFVFGKKSQLFKAHRR